MEPLKIKGRRPEDILVDKLIDFLKLRDWWIKKVNATKYQSGLPDLFIAHQDYGAKWLEVKTPDKHKFTSAQMETFPKLVEHGTPVYIMSSISHYDCLFKDSNWWHYLDTATIEKSRELLSPLKDGPEARIQIEIIKRLTTLGWYCRITYGNEYQNGLPDVYATHKKYGGRWIEVKNPKSYRFQPSQIKTFPMMDAHSVGVWILFDPNQIDLLHKPANWREFLK